MSGTSGSPASRPHASATGAEQRLALAEEALDRGDAGRGRALAMLAARAAAEVGEPGLEAEALLCIARADIVASRLRSAHESAYRAAQLFDAIEQPASEVRALVWLAYVASSLRRNEAALASAMLATKLAEALEQPCHRVDALNGLGIALIANGDFERSDAALSRAAKLAEQAGDLAGQAWPRINRCYGEIVRATVERYLYDRPVDPGRLIARLDECRPLEAATAAPGDAAGGLAVQRALLSFAASFAACWRGDFVAAGEHAGRISPGARAGGPPAWLDALAMWAACESALAQGDWPAAEASVGRMIEGALQVEHEQVARTGYMLASAILDAQGRSREALGSLRLLAQRDIAIRRESLEHHERVAKWQLELRDSSIRMRRLEARSRRLERLSLEDALTGLPNRRHFERELSSLLGDGSQPAEPLSIALIDVDRFKEINDLHSHLIGDRVLKVLAGLIGGQVRHGDLPARLGGDEFVVLFRRADVAVAAAACERLKAAVQRHPWHEFVPGMVVTVSIGLAESTAGDTIESLLRRSDDDMYRAKANRS